jgi:hypothetical protein
MGTWGAALYSDDTTREVRDTYIQNLKYGLSDEEACQRILERHGDLLADHEIACLVYFALADTAWKYGRLTQDVQGRALALIEAGGDVFVWERDSPSDVASRRRALASLEARLRSTQPAVRPVKLSKPRPKKITTTDPVGTIYLLNLADGQNIALILVGFMDLGKHLGLFGDDGRKNVMTMLLRTGLTLETKLPYDADSVVFGNLEYVRSQINAHFPQCHP